MLLVTCNEYISLCLNILKSTKAPEHFQGETNAFSNFPFANSVSTSPSQRQILHANCSLDSI